MLPFDNEFKIFLSQNIRFKASSDSQADLYTSTLLGPIQDFLSRPKKGFRFELIQWGYEIAAEYFGHKNTQPDEKTLSLLNFFNDVVELLHSGSLIVDDIEDQSKMRRGKPTLHEIYGLPIALNAGNWLYFWPLVMIQNARFSEALKTRVLMECHKTLLLAHTGQALDIGAPVANLKAEQVAEVVFKTMELKSGALASLAMKLGALIFIESDFLKATQVVASDVFSTVGNFGSHFGQLLQIYDDIGNLSSVSNPLKKYEDLKLMRPSFFWFVLSENTSAQEYQDIVMRIQTNYDEAYLNQLIQKKDLLVAAQTQVHKLQVQWREELFTKVPQMSNSLKIKISTTLERLSNAY